MASISSNKHEIQDVSVCNNIKCYFDWSWSGMSHSVVMTGPNIVNSLLCGLQKKMYLKTNILYKFLITFIILH